MPRKLEYGIVHIDAVTGFLLADTLGSMEDVKVLASEGTGDCKGTYTQGEWLRIAGALGWELICPIQDKLGVHWYFKREVVK